MSLLSNKPPPRSSCGSSEPSRVLGQGKCKVSDSNSPVCFGGESFGYFAAEKPSPFYWLGGAKGRPHAGNYDVNHDVLTLGVAVHCRLAWEYLKNAK